MTQAACGPLDSFDPLVARWFVETIGTPTDAQEGAWRELASGRHALVCAPTGCGKTFAAFLSALDCLALGEYPAGELSVLYVSPLKALNADIRRNLLVPLEGLRAAFASAGRPFPDIRVAVRSGDTTPAERREFLRSPPSILATTPESLALLLNSPRARALLSTIRLVVLDEIHALAPNKRGAFLMVQLERLALLSGEFTRVALSATVADPASIARFAAGVGADGKDRPISLVLSRAAKKLSLSVRYPPPLEEESAAGEPEAVSRWAALADRFIEEIRRNRTTLVFVNSRRHAEKIAFLVNERAGEELAWAHHGSLSREVRYSIEDRLKRGLLKAVVATGSLELGIDIGSVDQVLLVGTPAGAAAALQRIGRAGHRLGAESSAAVYPLHPLDLLYAAASVRDVLSGRLEDGERPRSPLDVLAQLLLSMAAMDDWDSDELFATIRRADPFRDLSRADFDSVVEMLRGRFEDGRLPSLSSRLDRSAPPGTIRAKRGALPLLYASGGVIPDRGSFALLAADTRAPLGELDEEFVWERRIGDGFALGSRAWRIVGIDDRTVTVVPSSRGIQIVPFWRAESQWRSLASMNSVLDLLEESESEGAAAFAEGLASSSFFDADSVLELALLLELQRGACPLPTRDRVCAEDFSGPDGQGRYSFLHTMRGGRVNAALGIALRAAADRRWGAGSVEFFWDDAGILASFSSAEELALAGPSLYPVLAADIASAGFARLLAEAVEQTGLFGAAFRENAGRALLLPKGGFGKRTPLWMTRLRAKRLYEAVRSYADFPVTRETWRTCLRDILDPDAASRLVSDIAGGSVELAFADNILPSPFARGSVWIASDSFMYRRDEGSAASATDEELIRSLLASDRDQAEPRVSDAVAVSVVARLKRLDPDYAPRDEADSLDWLDERLLIEDAEWNALAASLPSGISAVPERLRLPGAEGVFVVSPDLRSRKLDEADLFSRWLRYEGPVSEGRAAALFGPDAVDILRGLLDAQAVVRLRVGEGPAVFCDAELASRLLRAERAAHRSSGVAGVEMSLGELQAISAAAQGVRPAGDLLPASTDADASVERLKAALEPLLGTALSARLWERDVFPARSAYLRYHLELLQSRYPVLCFGASGGRVGFSLADELSFSYARESDTALSAEAAALLGALVAGSPEASRAPIAAYAELAESGRLGSARFAPFVGLIARNAEPEPRRGEAKPFGAPRARGDFPSRARWERSRAGSDGIASGHWLPLERKPPADAVEGETVMREKARRLIARYGVLSRSIAALEEDAPPWTALFRSLRLMEFSGEIVGGRFVAGIDELQFRFSSPSPGALSDVYCLCARDPASLGGLPSFASFFGLPPRLASSHFVWRGSKLLLVSRRNGRELDFRVEAEDPDAPVSVDALCGRLALRAVDPIAPLLTETVNDTAAARSPYSGVLMRAGFVEALKGLEYVPRSDRA